MSNKIPTLAISEIKNIFIEKFSDKTASLLKIYMTSNEYKHITFGAVADNIAGHAYKVFHQLLADQTKKINPKG